MSAYKNILVPVDFSDDTENLIKIAVEIAQTLNARVTIYHVHHYMQSQFPSDAQLYSEILEKLKAYEKKVEPLSLIERSYKVDFGLPDDNICNYADQENYDLIIMSTRYDHDIIDRFIGSIALNVLRASNVPVLVIPEGRKGMDIVEVAFATDLKKLKSVAMLDHLKAFVTAFNAELILVHVNPEPEKLNVSTGDNLFDINEYLEDVPHRFEFVRADKIEEGLRTYIEEQGIDILAIMPRKHSFPGNLFHHSISKGLTDQLNFPLFSFHE